MSDHRNTYYLVIDAGTTRFKVALITPEGKAHKKANRYYSQKPSNFHIYTPGDFIESLKHTFGIILKDINHPQIRGIGVTGHGPTLIPVSKDGKPLYTAIGYLDERVSQYVKRLKSMFGDNLTSSMYIPIALYFKEEHPDTYQKTYRFLQSFDYINYLLTGNFCSTSSDLGISPWTNSTLESAGLDPDKFSRIYGMGVTIGETSQNAFELFGIPPGIPVHSVGIDFAAAILGTGALDRGKSCERAGSSGGINLCWDKPVDDPRLLCYSHFKKTLYNIAAITSTSGRALQWIGKICGSFKVSPPKSLTELKKIIFLPYLKGERTPLWNPKASGLFFGLRDEHTRRDIILSVYTGICLSVRDCIEIIEENGCEFTDPVAITGWGAKIEWFVKLKAAVTGKRYMLLQTEDGELLGCMIVCAVNDRFYNTIEEAVSSVLKVKKIVEPDPNEYEYFADFYEKYKRLRKILYEE